MKGNNAGLIKEIKIAFLTKKKYNKYIETERF